MDLLPLETWNIILSLLESNNDKFHLLISFKDMLKCSVLFDGLVDIGKIIHSQWFDNFKSVRIIYGDRRTKYINFPRDSKNVEIIYKGTIEGASSFNGRSIMINNKISTFDLHFHDEIESLIFNCSFYKNYVGPFNELANMTWSFKDMNIPTSLRCITFTATINSSRRFENIKFVKHNDNFQHVTIDNRFNTFEINEFPVDTKNIRFYTNWNTKQGDIHSAHATYI